MGYAHFTTHKYTHFLYLSLSSTHQDTHTQSMKVELNNEQIVSVLSECRHPILL